MGRKPPEPWPNTKAHYGGLSAGLDAVFLPDDLLSREPPLLCETSGNEATG